MKPVLEGFSRETFNSGIKMSQTKRPNRKKRLTLAEIALQAGVSRQVVSAVINPGRKSNIRFSPETYERVMRIVEASNWRPNRTAINLANRRHGNIGLLVQNFGKIPEGVLEVMIRFAHDFSQVVVIDSFPEESIELPLFLREDFVDAVVLFDDIDTKLLKKFDDAGIPLVRVNTNVRDEAGCITFDEEDAMEKAADHFVALGRKRTMLFHGNTTDYWTTARIDGLRQAASVHGMEEPVFLGVENYYNPFFEKQVKNHITETLQRYPDIDSAILLRDRMAPLFYSLMETLGKRIPEDMAVVAMHNTGVAHLMKPRLSTLHMHPVDIGEYIIQVVNAGIDNTKEFEEPLPVPYDLLVEESSK